MVRGRVGPVLAGILFGLIVLGALDPGPLKMIGLHGTPDRKVPRYPLFLREVAARTRPGQSVAIAAPMQSWSAGYAYAYYRASYFLAGRTVVPLMDPDDRPRFDRLRQADFVAAWRMDALPGPYAVVWTGHDGVLYRRTR